MPHHLSIGMAVVDVVDVAGRGGNKNKRKNNKYKYESHGEIGGNTISEFLIDEVCIYQ